MRFGVAGSSIAATVAVLAGLLAAAAAAVGAAEASPRVVVIGEVGGAANAAEELLRGLGVVDEAGRWAAGGTILVQTGDLVDGGENVHAALDLFMRLEEEAAAAGGRVVVLLGNHEVLNVLGDLSQVNYMAYQHFAGADAALQQDRAWQAWAGWRAARAAALGEDFDPAAVKDEWLATHPPGWVEYAMAMRPEGVYGRWLRGLPAAFAVGDTVFLHAGLTPATQGMDVETINRQVREEIARFDDYRARMAADGLCLPFSSVREMVDVVGAEIDFVNGRGSDRRLKARREAAAELQDLTKIGGWMIISEGGPLWWRGATTWDEAEKAAELAALLDGAGFQRMVVGHASGPDKRIHCRFAGRVVVASTDLSDDPWVSDAPGALEIVDGAVLKVTPSDRELLVERR